MRKNADNISLFIKVLGYLFLILALFVGTLYVLAGVFSHMKHLNPTDFFSLTEVIVMGAVFVIVTASCLFLILMGKKRLLPIAFIVSSGVSLAFLLYVFFVLLAKMNLGGNESFFTSIKFASSFFILSVMVMVIFSSVIPFIFLRKSYFNPLIHSVSYIVEAILWVVIFILMIGKISPITGFLVMAFIFLRSGLYWWLLELRKESGNKEMNE
ncbi:MAG: hypothetical protein K6G74_04660 [Bacilli bacterium]|nr:hypothetical protein [Bacilli bacterium]